MITIENVEVTFEVEGEDAELFRQHFLPSVERWYRAVKEAERAELERREDGALVPGERR